MSTAMVWFRRDLRLYDHPALGEAVRRFERVVPVFVLDPALGSSRYHSDPRTGFMFGCLRDLDDSLRRRGSRLVILSGPPEREIPAAAIRFNATAVFWTGDVSPYARRRDSRVREGLRETGVEARQCAGNYVVPIGRMKTAGGTPYRVFSPFFRNWAKHDRREILDAPKNLGPGVPDELGDRMTEVAEPRAGHDLAGQATIEPGEQVARRTFSHWLAVGLDLYPEQSDQPGRRAGTSGVSPWLRWGCLSPAELEARALSQGGPGASAWVRQICWRDFHAHVLLHWPENMQREFQPRMRSLEWEDSTERLHSWQDGTTGFPIVDAAMRQLAATGWMHNRARLIAGSFLTKDLQLDWRHGENWFARLLLDGDPAQNNGNWQWIASVGTDSAPVARRLYNPVKQSERHDPHGEYIRRWVPELRDVPSRNLHEPWGMTAGQQREAGCRIGFDYPEPIVEHAFERRIALERYARARQTNPTTEAQ